MKDRKWEDRESWGFCFRNCGTTITNRRSQLTIHRVLLHTCRPYTGPAYTLKKSTIYFDLFNLLEECILGSFSKDTTCQNSLVRHGTSSIFAHWQPSCKFPCCAIGKGQLFRAKRRNLSLKSQNSGTSATPSYPPPLPPSEYGRLFTSYECLWWVPCPLGCCLLFLLLYLQSPGVWSSEITRCEMIDVVKLKKETVSLDSDWHEAPLAIGFFRKVGSRAIVRLYGTKIIPGHVTEFQSWEAQAVRTCLQSV